ncbi:hypothetical protein GSY63_24300 [Mucilaginibacter sp. R11]|uniref:Uncharacterized protein n=2 Tax=Mucilaginibacter agri TaxID=2695265 RepID=A0A965ZJW5_9SPHI|nr:hypothetical protein [Mucilaginibacter agri]
MININVKYFNWKRACFYADSQDISTAFEGGIHLGYVSSRQSRKDDSSRTKLV